MPRPFDTRSHEEFRPMFDGSDWRRTFVSGYFKEYEPLGNAAIEVVSNFTPRRADFH
jgi:hypothetical protein